MDGEEQDSALNLEEDNFETLENLPPVMESVETGDPGVFYETGAKTKPKPKPKQIGTYTGEITPGIPGALQPIQQKAVEAEKTFAYAQGLSAIKNGSMIAQSYQDFSDIMEFDANKINELNEKHFAKWEEETTTFKKEIDSARAMRVNPNRYNQSIGTGGRVASTFAVGVSQLASGAGNPNSVMKRIESAIDRDIAAQEYNIKQAWMGVAQMQNQQGLERQMFADYITYKDRAKSYQYTALSAKIGAIKQNAANETEYLAYQMIEDRFNAAAIKSIADALAAMGTFHIDMPIHNMAELMRGQGYSTQAQQLMSLGQSPGELPPTTLEMQSGQQVGPGGPIGPGAPQPGAAPTAALPAPEAAAPAPQASAPRTRASKATGGSRPTPSAKATPTETTATTTLDQGPPSREQEVDNTIAGAQADMSPEELKAGGAGRWEKRDLQSLNRVLSVADGIKEVEKGNVDVAVNLRDAEKYRKADISLNPPTSQLPNEVRDKIRNRVKLTDAEAQMVASDNAAMQYRKARQENNEYYLRPMQEKQPGEPIPFTSNFVKLNGGGYLRIKSDSSAYGGKSETARRSAQEKREAVGAQYDQIISYVNTIADSAENMKKAGSGSILGILSFDENSDGHWLPVQNEEYLTAMGFNTGIQSLVGAQVMKLIDESGRLTDMDIRVGRAIGLAMQGEWTDRVMDNVNAVMSWAQGKDKNAYRESAAKVMRLTTMAIIDQIYNKGAHSSSVLLSAKAGAQLGESRARAEKWLQTQPAQKRARPDQVGVPQSERSMFRQPEGNKADPNFWNQPLIKFGKEDGGPEDSKAK